MLKCVQKHWPQTTFKPVVGKMMLSCLRWLLLAVPFSVKMLPNFDADARSHQYFITPHENSCDFEGLIFLLQDRSLLCLVPY